MAALELDFEDYGQAVIYKGAIENCTHALPLDGHHVIETGKVFPVWGNTWHIITQTRFAPHFEFIGNFDKYYDIFEGCGTALPFKSDAAEASCC